MESDTLVLRCTDTKGGCKGTFELVGHEVYVGRDERCTIVLDQPSVSRWQCRIFRPESETNWMIEDLGSTNGTHLNGTPLVSVSERLAPGDVIRFAGSIELRLLSIPTQPRARPAEAFNAASGEASVFWWAIVLLSMLLKEEEARRRDTEQQVDTLRRGALRLRIWQEQLAVAEHCRAKAERDSNAARAELDMLREQVSIRSRQWDDDKATIASLVGRLMLYEAQTKGSG